MAGRVALLGSLALALALPAAAQGASCAASGSSTVRQNADVRVYRIPWANNDYYGHDYRACSKENGRDRPLGLSQYERSSDEPETEITVMALTGRRVGWVYWNTFDGSEINVYNPFSDRRRRVEVGDPRVLDVEVSPRGRVAWLEALSPALAPRNEGVAKIGKVDANGRGRLDRTTYRQGQRVPLTDLARSGEVVTWRSRGARKSYRLR